MSTDKFSLICFFDGVLNDEPNKFAYTGGKRKLRNVTCKISYKEFMEIMYEVSKSRREETALTLKYSYSISQKTIVMDIDCEGDIREMFIGFPNDCQNIHVFIIKSPLEFKRRKVQNYCGMDDTSKMALVRFQTAESDYGRTSSCGSLLESNSDSEGNALNCCRGQRTLSVGSVYGSKDIFQNALREFAMLENFQLKPLRTSPKTITARCANESCPWRIHASKLPGEPSFKIRTYTPQHTCAISARGRDHRQATSKWIAGHIREHLKTYPSFTPNQIISYIQENFGVTVSYRKAWKAKEIATTVDCGRVIS